MYEVKYASLKLELAYLKINYSWKEEGMRYEKEMVTEVKDLKKKGETETWTESEKEIKDFKII